VTSRSLPALLVIVVGCATPAGMAVPVGYAHVGGPSPARETFCRAPALADSTVYDTTQLTQRPVLYEAQRLKYPRSLRAHGVQGVVLLAVIVNTDGRLDTASIQAISSPDPELTNAATRWARSTKFVPACFADRPVRARVSIPVEFKVDN